MDSIFNRVNFPQQKYLSRAVRISLLTRSTCQKTSTFTHSQSPIERGINSLASYIKFQPSYTKLSQKFCIWRSNIFHELKKKDWIFQDVLHGTNSYRVKKNTISTRMIYEKLHSACTTLLRRVNSFLPLLKNSFWSEYFALHIN